MLTMHAAIWTILFFGLQVLSAAANVSSAQSLDHESGFDFNNSSNSVISFQSGAYSFQGTRDDERVLGPPPPTYTSHYAFLGAKMQEYFSSHDAQDQIRLGKKIIHYTTIKMVLHFSTRGASWTWGEALTGTSTLLNFLAGLNCQNPVDVHIKIGRKLVTFTTTPLRREQVILAVPPRHGATVEGLVGSQYPTEILNGENFLDLLSIAREYAVDRGEILIDNPWRKTFVDGQVACKFVSTPPAGSWVAFSEMRDAVSRIMNEVPAVAFKVFLVRGNGPLVPDTLIPLATIACSEFTGPAQNDGSQTGHDDGSGDDDDEADWSQILSEMLTGTNKTLDGLRAQAKNVTGSVDVFSV